MNSLKTGVYSKVHLCASNIMWHICSRQELWSQQRWPLLGNGSANTSIARQQLCNVQQSSNLEVVFSTQSVPIQESLLWQGPEAIVQVNYRPILSSERGPHIKKPAIVWHQTKIWSWALDGSPTPRQIVGRKLTSTSTSRCFHLVREGTPQRQHSNFQTENNIWSQVPEWTWHQDILTDHQS
jgi:hypothetical protein